MIEAKLLSLLILCPITNNTISIAPYNEAESENVEEIEEKIEKEVDEQTNAICYFDCPSCGKEHMVMVR